VSPPRKIVYVLAYLPSLSAEESFYETHHRERLLAARARELGFESKLYVLTNRKEVRRVADDCEAWAFPVDRDRDDHGRHTSMAMLERLNAERPDLVVFKGMGYRLVTWLVARSRQPFRFAFIVGGTARDTVEPLAIYVLAESDQQIDKYFRRRTADGSVAVLPKTLLPTDFRNSQRKRYDIVSVGTLSERKNHEELVPLFPDYRVAIIGDGPLLGELRARAADFRDNVYIPGNLSRSQVLDVISESRLMVHPATMEGVPRVFGESFACGVPVVAIRSAIQGQFHEGVQGCLVARNRLIHEVRALLADTNRLDEIGSSARRWAMANLGPDAAASVARLMYECVFSTPPEWNSAFGWRNRARARQLYWFLYMTPRRVAKRLGLRKLLKPGR
jgi:glycosyltransferase involved in cell wall biosynthesis